MAKRPWILGGIGALVLVGLSAGSASAQQAPAQKSEEAPAALCGDCHEEAKTFASNPHALWARKKPTPSSPNALCESCHGDGTQHIESGGEKALIRGFHGRAGADFCVTCHGSTKAHASFATGIHASTETVNCLTCHSVHKADPKSATLLSRPADALCASCHPTQNALLREKPFAHRLGRGGLQCVSCHDPHGKSGRDSLRLTRTGELPCFGCHAEKRGPFVFEHVTGVAGDCLSCHEPHGSSNPKELIRARVDRLCLECHSTLSAETLGSQPPSFHNLRLPRYQNCTTCHVAVHGSNLSPALLK